MREGATNPLLLLVRARQLLTLRGPRAPRRGRELARLGIIEDGAALVRDGRIAAVGRTDRVRKLREARAAQVQVLEVAGKVVLPGFVDSHTHLAFAAPRLRDYELRLAGRTLQQIARAGGGIGSSATHVRRAGRAELVARVIHFARQALSYGTTTLEVKSGYGLTTEAEILLLEAVREAARAVEAELVPTFLGAHVVPPEFTRREYLRLVIEQMLPRVADGALAEFCDVFCDRGAFTVAEARRVLTAAARLGMKLKLHGEQVARTGATLLPGATFHLGRQDYAPARQLVEAGAAVALATDFNPGTSPTLNMQMVLSLACSQMRLSPAEAITAATVNAAHALRRGDRLGTLEPGMQADLAVMDVGDYREIPYYFGMNHCWMTIKRGRIAWYRKDGGSGATGS